MKEQQVPLCKDCRRIRVGWVFRLFGDYSIAECAKTDRGDDLVVGGSKGLRFAQYVREDRQACGPQGKWFESKKGTQK